jgi:zinc/manganese transport system permease protein
VGLSPLLGLQAFCIGAAMAMGGLGKRLFGRDVAIGMVMAFSLGLGSLFFSLYRGSGSSNQSYSILFGEVLGISRSDILITLVTSVMIVVLMGILYRPLLFASLDEDVAEARGIRVRSLGVLFLGILGLTVGQSVQVTGVLLIFALLVAPAAIAQRISARPARAIACSVVISVLFTWAALAMAYYEPYPVSFFLTAIAFTAYLIARAADGLQRTGRTGSADLATAEAT